MTNIWPCCEGNSRGIKNCAECPAFGIYKEDEKKPMESCITKCAQHLRDINFHSRKGGTRRNEEMIEKSGISEHQRSRETKRRR